MKYLLFKINPNHKDDSSNGVEFYDLMINLIKDFLENFLKAELTEFLNYEKHDYSGRNSGNSRNGSYLRDFLTQFGIIKNLNVSRDRNSVIFIDGLSIKDRRDTVANESVYLIIGINEDGYREILDFYIGASELASLWEEVLTNLKERGVQEVLLGVMDGLPGLKDSFLKVFPKADVQRCIVHKVLNTIVKVRKILMK